jgi:hypothetical protein
MNKCRILMQAVTVVAAMVSTAAYAQITNNLFSDDFSKAGVDTTKYAIDSPFFEGGKGDITPKVENGVLEFNGTVSQQWWAGATLRLTQSFAASPETNIVISVDRVEEQTEGTASRSALWIMDETRTKYVLYADVRGEGGWHFNRYIGETGDVRTGGGTDIAAFNGEDPVTGESYDNQGLHRMAAVINGQDVKLYLNGRYGTTVKFPFSPVVLQLGSYARANGDVAHTIFDNLRVDAVGTATFSLNALTMGTGQKAALTVKIPQGANANQAVNLEILNRRPTVAAPVGGTAGKLALTFEPGGPNTKTFDLEGLALGSTQLTLTNTIGLLAGNVLDVTVVKGATVLMEDTFTGNTLDASKWRVNNQSFEAGEGEFEVTQTGGALQISGVGTLPYWSGASVQTVGDFGASKDLPLVFEVDRVAIDPNNLFGTPSTGARSGVFITSYDTENRRTGPWVFFGQNVGETGWQVNVEPGSPTGSGTAIPAFAEIADTGKHRMKLVSDGSKVEVFLDGVSGGTFDMALGAFLKFELAGFARDIDDAVKATFDNAKIENVLPCIAVTPTSFQSIQGDASDTVTVSIPKLLNVAGEVKVTVTSKDPSVAEPEGASNGSLVLSYPTGTTTRTFRIVAKSAGNTTLEFTNDKGACVSGIVAIAVTPPPVAQVSDDFAGSALDTAKWKLDTTPLVEGGTLKPESAVTFTDGTVKLGVLSDLVLDWPGYTITTAKSFNATATSPIVFEIDRVKMEYTLVGGDSSKQRVGVWVRSGTNYIFFSELGSYNATAPGWQFHRAIGRAGDVLLGDPNVTGTYIAPFNVAKYTDQKKHRMRAVVNGTTAKLYLDGVLGAEVPFPFPSDITFGFGAYANFVNNEGNVVDAYWDNAVVQGFPAQPPSSRLSVSQSGGSLRITWTGTGTLQSTDSLTAPNWADVTPAPTGNTFTVAPTAKKETYYRVRQ